MALDQCGEKAAKRLAEMPDKLKQFPHNRDAVQTIRNVINQVESENKCESEHSRDEIVERAWELVASTSSASSGTGKSGRGTAGGAKAQLKSRLKESATPIEHLSQPYRFIDLPDIVVAPEPGLADHPIDMPLPEGYCGTIKVEWIADSPLLIGGAATGKSQGDGIVEPLKINGQYVLPGATLRGLVRSVTEIVAYAKMTQGNWHYRFGLRDFVHPYYVDDSGVSKVDKVKGGFLHIRTATERDLSETVVELNGERFVYELRGNLEWGHVRIPSLAHIGVLPNLLQPEIKNDRTGYPGWTGKLAFDKDNKDSKYSLLNMGKGDNIDFAKENGFRLVTQEHGRQVYDADPQGSKKGVMVVSGRLPGGNKIYEYFIMPNPSAPIYPLHKDTALLFERLHCRPGKGDKLEPEGSWRPLRKLAFKNTGIPVFYVGDPRLKDPDYNFFFGLTRLFKIPHRRSVGDVLYSEQPAHRPVIGDTYENVDLVENLFGYVMEPRDWMREVKDQSTPPAAVAKKGRVSFGFAPLMPDCKRKLSSAVEVIQMAPRASFAPFYLRGEVKDYSGPKAKIAGRKAYFPQFIKADPEEAMRRFRAFGEKQRQDVIFSSKNPPSPDTLSKLRFLMPDGDRPLTFAGEIRLDNVTAVEIGALLFAITHAGDREKQFRHMMGRGKPFGAGQVKIGRVRLALEANSAAGEAKLQAASGDEVYDPSNGKGFAEAGDQSLQPFLDAFETYMRGKVGQTYATQSAPILEWLGMSDPSEGAQLAEAGRLSYKAFENDPPTGNTLKQFEAYRRLRDATQFMASRDQPRGKDRLLITPKKSPSKN